MTTSVVTLYAGEPGATPDPAGLPPELAGRRVLRQREAAELLGVSEATMERWRAAGKGPRHLKLSDRRIGYRVADLEAYLESRLSDPQSAA